MNTLRQFTYFQLYMKRRILRYLQFALLSMIMVGFQSCEKILFSVQPANTNLNNFELLWQTFDDKYCFFEEKNIKWDSLHNVYRMKIDNNMNSRIFFGIMASMLYELQDGHVGIMSTTDTSFYYRWKTNYNINFNDNILNSKYLNNSYKSANGIIWMKFNIYTGYIRCSSFSNTIYYDVMDTIISNLYLCKGIIIDIRNNGGGDKLNAEILMSYLFNNPTIIGYSREKNGRGHNDFTDYKELKISPKGKNRYYGTIVLLTNRGVFSAANYFASAMKARPNVVVVGDHTGGGGGIPISYELYNGWQFKLSSNPIFDRNGCSIEGGINPDFQVSFNDKSFKLGIDPIIDKAIEWIGQLN
jgi:hypothetical protein